MIPIPEFLLNEVPKGATHMSEPTVSYRPGGRMEGSFWVYKCDQEKGWLRYHRDADNEYSEWVKVK